MELCAVIRKLCNVETRRIRWLIIVGVVAVTHLLFQSLLLPYGNALRSMLPESDKPGYDESGDLLSAKASAKSLVVRNTLAVDKARLDNDSVIAGVVKEGGYDDGSKASGSGNGVMENGRDGEGEDDFVDDDLDDPVEVLMDGDLEIDFPSDNVSSFVSDTLNGKELESIAKLGDETKQDDSVKQNDISNSSMGSQDPAKTKRQDGHSTVVLSQKVDSVNNDSVVILNENSVADSAGLKGSLNDTTVADSAELNKGLSTLGNDSATNGKPVKKKMRCEMPPQSVTSIEEMNNILVRHRRSSRAMRPRWSSPRDQEILAARSKIENAPIVVNDRDLYAPVFRNVSKFKRSYELMESMLKVYIYKDGKRPIFHTPIMKGLYASEGWFMKLMEGNRQFAVKDPRRAHLFYMPFSSRMLEYNLYVRNSHNRTNLRQFLKEYTEKIASKYRYFNRTGGADHFLVACHDWAPYETRHHMEHCIKALCNADVTVGFKIGRDVSLPETYVRSARNPLRDLGGKPASQRHILAFYAGGMHGYVRPILLKYWKDKDASMKIFGPMPRGVASKMNYIQYMKSSKYCICPKGYEVNSPRVVEAIFYECVPVIISDNFIPPFFEALDWGAFSLILPEKDIPNLKDILLSIPEERYREMQFRVKKVQRHFLWHPKPAKYDLFYMTLHSIWYNRVYQIKAR